jgi:hypothetical protein
MSLSYETLLEIQSLADGELEGEARSRIEKLVAESAEARGVLEGLRAPHVGLWITESVDQRATAAGVDAIAENVIARLSGDRPLSAPVSAPVSALAVQAVQAANQGGVVARIDGPTRRAPARGLGARAAVVTAVSALALAAGVAFVLRAGGSSDVDRMPVASGNLPSVDMQGPPGQGGSGVEVDDVDSPRGISVFEIPLRGASAMAGAKSASSVVIWIDDEGTK